MAVIKEVKPYEPNPLGRLWMHKLEPPVRRLAEASYNAIKHIGAEQTKQQLEDALKELEYAGDLADWGMSAVRRGRAGEPLSAADWNVLAQCAKAMSESEARERERMEG